MNLGDSYRITLHTIKENKARSTLTVIIAAFLSALIIGMMSLAISFSINSNQLINEAYFKEDAMVTVDYQNKNVLESPDQGLFYGRDLYNKFLNIVDKYSDEIQYVSYTSNIDTYFEFVETKYPSTPGLNIVEGRFLETSGDIQDAVVSKQYYLRSLEEDTIEEQSIGSIHNVVCEYDGYDTRINRQVKRAAFITYKIVGIYDYPKAEKLVIDGTEDYFTHKNIILDIRNLVNQSEHYPELYISRARIFSKPSKKGTDPQRKLNTLNSLTNELNELLPQALKIEKFATPMGVERIEKYSDGAVCAAYNTLAENNAIRYVVVGSSIGLAVILVLMSIGSLANSVMISIDSSKKFIGLLKALGMKGKTLKLIVVLESITLISAGVLIGYLIVLALYVPLSALISNIVGFTYASFVQTAAFVGTIHVPIYLFAGALFTFLLFTYIFSFGSLHKIAKTDPMAVISEVS